MSKTNSDLSRARTLQKLLAILGNVITFFTVGPFASYFIPTDTFSSIEKLCTNAPEPERNGHTKLNHDKGKSTI